MTAGIVMPATRTAPMPAKIVVHSFMRETGKTNIAAGLAHLLVAYGERVGIIDADISVPVLHSRLGVDAKGLHYAFNHYLMGRCAITDAAVDLAWEDAAPHAGTLVLVPASTDPAAIRSVLHQDIDVRILNAGAEDLATAHSLDVVLINSPAGLDEISLSCMALADVLLIVLRLDKEDYHGTSVTIDLARNLKVPNILLAVNRASPEYEPFEIKRRVEETYGCDVPVVLSAADEAAMLFTGHTSVQERLAHPLAALLQALRQKAP